MSHNKIKNAFLSAVNSVIADPNQFAVNPEKFYSKQAFANMLKSIRDCLCKSPYSFHIISVFSMFTN